MLSNNDKLFHHLINYFYYYEEFDTNRFDSLFKNYKLNDNNDPERYTFIYDIINYTLKFNYKKNKLLEWILQKNLYINNSLDRDKNTFLHLISSNINEYNIIKSKNYIKILINFGANVFKKNINNECFIDIINNKINNKLSINVENDFNLICFDKNRLLNKDEQYEKKQ